MNVHLIHTSDVDSSIINEVLSILNSSKGPIKYLLLPINWQFSNNSQPNPLFNDLKITDEQTLEQFIDQKSNFSWHELFTFCQIARSIKKIPADDIVILITNKRNENNFFSMFDFKNGNNAFIQASDWFNFVNYAIVYPIAYEVGANILRLKMNTQNFKNINQIFHEEPLGCVNDFCRQKSQIILKLRTGDICYHCVSRLQSENEEEHFIIQILETFEKIRLELKFVQGFFGIDAPNKISVNHNGDITVGDILLKLTPIEKTILIFFLNKLEGIPLIHLSNYKTELFRIYQHLKVLAKEKNIEDLVSPIAGNFSYNKSRLSSKIINQLGKKLAQFYTITGIPGGIFKIIIDPKLVYIDSKFKID